MRGGSLTRFRTDEADQEGAGLFKDMLKGGIKGVTSTRNPLKLPSNTIGGLKTGLTRGIKRKAETALKKEISKKAKQVLKNKNLKQAVQIANQLFPKQVKRARDIFGV